MINFDRVPRFVRNFYFITGVVFLIWMLFIDSNDIITQIKLRNKVRNLENEKVYYEQKIEEVKQDRKELLTDQEMLEKFAREKYFMKKENEEIYLVIEED